MISDTTSKRDLSKELLEIYKKGCDAYEDDRVIEVEVNSWFTTHSEPPSQIFKIVFERSKDETDYKTLLAFMYCLGIGTEIDKFEMFRYYLMAAEQGDPVAANQAGWCFYDGVGTRKNPEKAFHWFQRSAYGGYALGLDAANELGYCYQLGIGTRSNKYKSSLCYRTSAFGSYQVGKYNYAYSFHNGFRGSVDKHQAIYWYRRAFDCGYGDAKKQLDYLFKTMHLI
ncbi:11421_t:CDS:2 [Ambispora leptoticha]|uniref:11421_t:CDS:1 n=1 Tax=Ambispora leptoticha TaxID=144679 RepID=A0A9N8ZEU8_9GLOM|nr:11421_t:CDS:2 [Ambispora leptoticha]